MATINACVSCHVGPEISSTSMFLGPDGLDRAYDALVTDRAINGGFDPAAATLLLKGMHEGPAWTTPQADKIAAWLRAELAERGPVTPDPDPGTRSALTPNYGEIMIRTKKMLDDWLTAFLAEVGYSNKYPASA
jgi:hypothetical protein